MAGAGDADAVCNLGGAADVATSADVKLGGRESAVDFAASRDFHGASAGEVAVDVAGAGDNHGVADCVAVYLAASADADIFIVVASRQTAAS